MKTLNNYILEKFKISNDTNTDTTLKVGSPLYFIWLEDFEDEDTSEVISIFRIATDPFYVTSIDDKEISFNDGKDDDERTYTYYINSNNLYERKDYEGYLFIDVESFRQLLSELINEKNDSKKVFGNYFDKKYINSMDHSIEYDKEHLKKILTRIKRKFK